MNKYIYGISASVLMLFTMAPQSFASTATTSSTSTNVSFSNELASVQSLWSTDSSAWAKIYDNWQNNDGNAALNNAGLWIEKEVNMSQNLLSFSEKLQQQNRLNDAQYALNLANRYAKGAAYDLTILQGKLQNVQTQVGTLDNEISALHDQFDTLENQLAPFENDTKAMDEHPGWTNSFNWILKELSISENMQEYAKSLASQGREDSAQYAYGIAKRYLNGAAYDLSRFSSALSTLQSESGSFSQNYNSLLSSEQTTSSAFKNLIGDNTDFVPTNGHANEILWIQKELNMGQNMLTFANYLFNDGRYKNALYALTVAKRYINGAAMDWSHSSSALTTYLSDRTEFMAKHQTDVSSQNTLQNTLNELSGAMNQNAANFSGAQMTALANAETALKQSINLTAFASSLSAQGRFENALFAENKSQQLLSSAQLTVSTLQSAVGTILG